MTTRTCASSADDDGPPDPSRPTLNVDRAPADLLTADLRAAAQELGLTLTIV